MDESTFKRGIAAIERGLARCKPGEKPMDQALHIWSELANEGLKVVNRPGAWRKLVVMPNAAIACGVTEPEKGQS